MLGRARLGLPDQRFLAFVEMLEQGLLGAREALAVGEIHQPLQVHFAHIDRIGEVDEGGKLADGLLEAGQPQRYPRCVGSERALQRAELAHVLDDAVEHVLAAHGLEGLRLGGVERNPQLVEPARDEVASAPLVQQGAVGIEQDVGPARFEIADHARQVRHHQRLAHAVKHHAGDVGILIDDRPEQVPAHVRRGLKLLERPRTGRARQIAAIGRLQIQADRIGPGDLVAIALDRLEIAAGIDVAFRRRCAHAALRAVSCGMRISPSPRARIANPL